MKIKENLFLIASVFIILSLSCCSRNSDINVSEGDDDEEELPTNEENAEDHDDSDDYIWDSSEVIYILLNENAIIADAEQVSIDESTLTISSSGTYNISGSLTDGQIIVDSEDEDIVRLILDGVTINCSYNSPVLIKNAEKTLIVLAENTDNYVSDGSSYSYENSDDDFNAAIYSKDDLTIYGEGSLTVNGNYNDGITSKDGFIIASGTLFVTAVDDGIRGKDYLIIKDGDITINADGDGLKSDNDEDTAKGYISIETGKLTINSGGDAITAETDVLIDSGEINIISGGGSSANNYSSTSTKGIKAGVSISINEGNFTISSADDALHSNGTLEINGGTFGIASGDDGIHAESDLIINGGTVIISKSYEGIESGEGNITINDGELSLTSSDDGFNVSAGGESGGGGGFKSSSSCLLSINGGYIVVDATGDGLDSNGSIEITDGTTIVHGPTSNSNGALDCNGTFNITGGFLVAAGSSGMAEAPDNTSSQNSVKVKFNSTQQAGSLVHIETDEGDDILSFAPKKRYQSIVFSSSALSKGENYNLYLGGSSTGTETDGLYTGGTYTPGNKYTSFTISGTTSNVN